ncbi:hypothetical protein [Fulvivirga lutea]|uniref:Uncharacterized protein n=1 Tax=Fulvivirga lutea TaxID=2810512 RepID=A0A974WHB7_9BACT|nr:hypothetical protein [Fulvivirga lutea]QSE97237.1 hypothetical protein JR347_16845 [Fulvivirga lutea]
MTTTTIITLLSIILPLIGAGIGYLIKQNIEKRKELLSEVHKERRELYQQFVNLIVDIFKQSKAKKDIDKEFINTLYEIYKKYILYGSPAVINSFADFFQYLYSTNEVQKSDTKIMLELLSRIMVEMRKDLGLENKGLGQNGNQLLRAMFTDYNKIMEQK